MPFFFSMVLGLMSSFSQGTHGGIKASGAELLVDLPAAWYVGQAVTVELRSKAGSEALGASTTMVPTDAGWLEILRAGPGRWYVVPKEVGAFVLPAFTVEGDGVVVRSRPRRVEVRAVPIEGRPAQFLGGVGELRIATRVDTMEPIVGQPFGYEIELEGPGALATRVPADTVGWIPATNQVERVNITESVDASVPSKRIVITLIPLVEGALRLPAISISAFQPRSGRFATVRSRFQTLVVRPRPSFDAGTIEVRPPGVDEGLANRAIVPFVIGVGGLSAAVALLILARRGGHFRPAGKLLPSRAPIDEARRWLATSPAGRSLGHGVVHHVAAILQGLGSHPVEWPTPDEAAAALIVGSHPNLAGPTRRLLQQCDARLFGLSSRGQGTMTDQNLRDEFRRWLTQAESAAGATQRRLSPLRTDRKTC